MILRLRSPTGQFRIEVELGATTSFLKELIARTLGYRTLNFTVSKEKSGSNPLQMDSSTVESLGLCNGDILYTTYKEPVAISPKKVKVHSKFVKQHPIDEMLLREKGTINRSRNPTFCKHADMGMCEYCLPLQPYDSTYLEENKIKHMSFHAYLRQIIDREKIPSVSNEHFIPPLDIPDYRVLDPCPSNSHAKYPEGICSKCQPSAITLQTQNFRMVDHVEFEDPILIENFLSYWRASGNQRCGYLFGRYEAYDKVPLGVKAIVSVIYEPPQICGHDNIQLENDEEEESVLAVTKSLGLEMIGIIYTDLFDDGTGKGTVICKRHARSFFLSSAEIIFSALLQQKYPVKTPYSPTSEFGSRFVTCVVSGNTEGGIDIQSYQVSNAAQSMTRDGIIEASTEPSLMRVCLSTAAKYVPDVFYKYKNEYSIMVQEAAKPTFPVEYLLITSSHGFPSQPYPSFSSNDSFIENRVGMSKRGIPELANLFKKEPLMKLLSDFHLLLFLKESSIVDNGTFEAILSAVKNKSADDLAAISQSPEFATFKMILDEASLSATVGSSSGGGSSNSAPWPCRHCTFVNIQGESCEMCGLPKD